MWWRSSSTRRSFLCRTVYFVATSGLLTGRLLIPESLLKLGLNWLIYLLECWSEPRVTSIVNEFNRYLRADENTLNIYVIIGFRCQIAIEDLADILENLAMTMGDISLSIIIHLERTAPFGEGNCGTLFAGGDLNENWKGTKPTHSNVGWQEVLITWESLVMVNLEIGSLLDMATLGTPQRFKIEGRQPYQSTRRTVVGLKHWK